jgi:uncharacterized membrane protein
MAGRQAESAWEVQPFVFLVLGSSAVTSAWVLAGRESKVRLTAYSAIYGVYIVVKYAISLWESIPAVPISELLVGNALVLMMTTAHFVSQSRRYAYDLPKEFGLELSPDEQSDQEAENGLM